MKKITLLLLAIFPMIASATEVDSEYAVENSKIYKTITMYDMDENVIDSMSFEVTEEQYEKEEVFPEEYIFLHQARSNTATHQTEYKRLTLKVVSDGYASTNIKKVTVTNEWLKIPAVKSNDILGVYYTGTSPQVPAEFIASQIYNGGLTYTYYSDSTNRVSKTNGQAIVMNIIDEVSTSLKNTLEFRLSGNNTNLVLNASYQHATSDVTNSEAMNVKFGTSANSGYQVLGNTFIYKNSIANKYDKMQGVSVAFDPYDFS